MTDRTFSPARGLTMLAAALLVVVSGCATTRQPGSPAVAEITRAEETSLEAAQPGTPMIATDEPVGAPLAVDTMADDRSKLLRIKPGTGKFLNEAAASPPRPAPATGGEVTFNFEGESLLAVVKAILGDVLGQNYVIAPGVQGTVTFSTAKPVRPEQTLAILEMLLRWNNATLVWQDGRYTVLPIANAIPGNLTPRVGSAASARGYEVRAYPLEYISATEMEKLLKPYARPEAVVNVDQARNMIVLAGTREELVNYAQTIDIFDVDWLAGMSVGVFALEQAEAGEVVQELEKVFGEGAPTPLAGMFRFMPLEGANAIMVITAQQHYLSRIEDWIDQFDIGSGQGGQRLYVYDVENSKAADLADTLNNLFGNSGGQSAASSRNELVVPGLETASIRTVGTTPLARDRRAQREQRQNGGAQAEVGGPGSNLPSLPQQQTSGRRNNVVNTGDSDAVPASGPVVDAQGGIALAASEDVRISAVEESNALLVLASPSQWESIRRVIERLDQIPLQVQIEAQLVRVALDNELRFGVSWAFEEAITPESDRVRASMRDSFSDIAGEITQSGLSWTFLGRNAKAIITALDRVADTTVISAPSVVVLNNKTATINVGRQIPIQTAVVGGQPGTGFPGGVNTSSFTQYLRTGNTLDVTPRVNPGGLVFLEISQESSTPGTTSGDGANPPIDNRSISTSVAVQSGQTVVMGGLIEQTDSSSKGGVPFLSRIPILGALFGTQGQLSAREELILLITPRVVRNPMEARELTEEYKRRFRALEPLRVRLDNPGE